jgi:hypothetical protein
MNPRPRTGQIPLGPLLGAIGAVLLIVSLFLEWYEDRTGFTVFEFLDLFLVGLALATLAALASTLGLLRTPVRPSVPLLAGTLALLVVLSQLVNDPPAVAGPNGREQDMGIWLALAGAALMMAGAVLATARIAIAVEPRNRPGAPPAATRVDEAPTRVDEAPTVADQPPPPRP